MNIRTVDNGRIRLPVPAGYETRQDPEGEQIIITAPQEPTGGFRPNLISVTGAYSGSIRQAGTQAVAQALASLPSAYIVNYAAAVGPDGTEHGRWIEYTYEVDRWTLHGQQWLFLSRGMLIRTTITCTPVQLLSAGEVLRQAATSLRLVDAGAERPHA